MRRQFPLENLTRRDLTEDQHVDEKVILRWILRGTGCGLYSSGTEQGSATLSCARANAP
jgi:hypothetical protein